MGVIGRVAIGAASLVARVVPHATRSAEAQARVERAAAGVDRELAGNLELITMYLQTKQPAILENAAYLGWRDEIASADAELAARLAVVYERMPDAETAMERRGPAGSIRSDDRATVQQWEGNARALQRALRELPGTRPRSAGDRLVAWVRARMAGRTAARP